MLRFVREPSERKFASLAGCDAVVCGVSQTVNGPLFSQLEKEIGHGDPASELFREGAPLLGALPVSGMGVRVATEVTLLCGVVRGSGETGFLCRWCLMLMPSTGIACAAICSSCLV